MTFLRFDRRHVFLRVVAILVITRKVLKLMKIAALLFAVSLAFSLSAAESPVTFVDDTLVDGAVIDGIRLDLNGNVVENGIVTIGEKPLLVKGITGRAVTVRVVYIGEVEPENCVAAAVSCGDEADVTGVWSDGARIHGVWKGTVWDNVNVPSALHSGKYELHDFVFAYGADAGTRFSFDGKSVYRADALKSMYLAPSVVSVGGAASASPVRPAAKGMRITSITVYPGMVDVD